MPKEKSAAIITIHAAPAMTFKGRLAIARWMIRQAFFFLRYGKDYTEGRFRARYLYQ